MKAGVLWGTEWVVVCLDPNTSLGSGRLQTAAAACGNHRAHANEIKQQRRNGASIHLCGVNTITEMTVCVFPSSAEQQEGPLAGVNNPVCTAWRDWLEGGGQEGRDEHSLQPDDLLNYLGKTMSFCTHYALTGIHFMTRIPLLFPQPPHRLSHTHIEGKLTYERKWIHYRLLRLLSSKPESGVSICHGGSVFKNMT